MAETTTEIKLGEGQFQDIIDGIVGFLKSFLDQIIAVLAKLETKYGFEDADA